VSVLIALDFPAFERPTNATSGPAAGGNPAGFAIEVTNAVPRKKPSLLRCIKRLHFRENCHFR
jgi:hypothetical protein